MAKAKTAIKESRIPDVPAVKAPVKGVYKAFTVVRQASGLCSMRTLTIQGALVISTDDDVEDLWRMKVGKIVAALEEAHQ